MTDCFIVKTVNSLLHFVYKLHHFVRFNLGSLPVLLAALLFCLPLTQWCKNRLESWVVQDGRGQGRQALVSIGTAMMNVVLLLVCTALLVGDSYNPFLYFRF